MSCGRPHEVDCGSVLAALDAFIDGEDSALDRAKIAAHLHECGPCLEEQHIEQLVRAVVARSCAAEPCSEAVRAGVIGRIRAVSVQVTLRNAD
jgi:anti-sigma factor (TIGR02949 family)